MAYKRGISDCITPKSGFELSSVLKIYRRQKNLTYYVVANDANEVRMSDNIHATFADGLPATPLRKEEKNKRFYVFFRLPSASTTTNMCKIL